MDVSLVLCSVLGLGRLPAGCTLSFEVPKPSCFKESAQEAASKYADWVEYRGLDSSFRDRVNSWLMFCFTKGSHELHLQLSTYEFHNNSFYKFPVIQPSLCPNLKLLKSLALNGLVLANEALESLLSACDSLERLQLRSLRSLSAVKVTGGPESRLISIDVRGCREVRSVEIDSPTPDLVSFQLDRVITNMHIEYAPRLAHLFIHLQLREGSFDLSSHPLFAYLSQLESLHLEVFNWEMANDRLPHDLPNLSRLKHLKLGLCYRLWEGIDRSHFGRQLQCLDSLIKELPSLQHLTLEMLELDPELKIGEEAPNLHLELPQVIELVSGV